MTQLGRHIGRQATVPPLAPGFAGPGHLHRRVVQPQGYARNNPFLMLAEDYLAPRDGTVGEPHPHAGFETATLVLEGSILDRYEGGLIRAGDMQWMTAGSGIIHNEDIRVREKACLLQLWLVLPKTQGWIAPSVQMIRGEDAPVR